MNDQDVPDWKRRGILRALEARWLRKDEIALEFNVNPRFVYDMAVAVGLDKAGHVRARFVNSNSGVTNGSPNS